MSGYLLLTFLLATGLEPGFTPPGFTGRGIFAMPVVLFGAFHTAKWCKSGAAFIVFGSVGALPVLFAYFGDSRLRFRLNSAADIRASLIACVAGVIAMGLLARVAATIRWKLPRRRLAGPPLCHTCGYDLRASTDRCPECGTEIRVEV